MRFVITSYSETEIHMLLDGTTPDLSLFSVVCTSTLHTLRYSKGISLCEFNRVGVGGGGVAR